MTFAASRSAPQQQFPDLPEPFASVRCDRCSWCWHRGAMRLKLIAANCSIHSRFLEAA